MAGVINSLGVGSGVLTSDLIDKLKNAEKKAVVDPIEAKVKLNQQKQQSLDLLKSLMTTLKSSTSALADDTMFSHRTVSGNNSDVEVSVENGVDVQSFSISNISLAKENVLQSGTFSSSTASVASTGGTMDLTINGQTYNIDYTAGMTLEEFRDKINDVAGSDVTASILQTGNSAYSLIVKSDQTGASQAITMTDTSGNLDPNLQSYTEVQAAKDATFTYNGINLTRSTNTIDDIVAGVTIKLLGESGSANISIEQDRQPIKDELQNFVNSYNSMIDQLDKMTLADKEQGKVGVFNGDSSIRNLGRELTKLITSVDDSGNSLSQFGVSLNKDGKLSFSSSDFDAKMDSDPTSLQKFFTGETTVDQYGNEKVVDGIFDKLNTTLKNSVGYGGSISILSEGLDKEQKSLEKNYKNSLALLNQRYDTMTARFVEYDSIIAKLNNQSASLMQQIQMAINAK